MLAVIVMVAAGIRLVFELLEPVVPYLAVGLVGFTGLRLVSWYRGRW